jgi:hypothetical protein
MDRDDRVAAIVLAAQHLAGLGLLDVRLELVEPLQEVAVDGFTGLRPLDQDAEIVGAALQRLAGRQFLVQAPAALEQFLGLGGILPEVGMRDAGLDLLELRAMARLVKDSSADRRPASRGPDIDAPVLPAQTPRQSPFPGCTSVRPIIKF